MKKISVYGSLLKGLGNHRLIQDSQLLGEEIVEVPFIMIPFGSSFPGLVKVNDNHKVLIETYEIDDNTYKRVESLEGYPSFYDKYQFNTPKFGESELYFLNGEKDNNNSIEKIDGVFNWKQHLINNYGKDY